MKKGFLVVLLFALISPVFSQGIPEVLEGIWEGKDRFIFFENASDDKNPELVVILKEYYGWYYDRAAEPEDYSDTETRTRNAATHKYPEIIPYTITTLNPENGGGDAFQIYINYSKHQSSKTTFAVVDDRIYLSVYTKYDEIKLNDTSSYTLWRGYQQSRGFLMYEQPVDENISLLIIDGDKFYDVRYWLTDMDYDSAYVSFNYKSDSYSVPKHLFADGTNYSSVNGRSKKVRNTMPPFSLSEKGFIYNDSQTVLITEQTPYLTKITDKNTLSDLFEIIKEANSRRKPDPDPIFPVKFPTIPGQEE